MDENTQLLKIMKDKALELDPPAFAKRYAGFYLLGRLPSGGPDEWSFATDIRAFDQVGRARTSSGGFAAASIMRFLAAIEKSDRNTWARRISVGRATNNDIIIRHESVSKLHAHFHFGTLKRPDLKGSDQLLLSDVGSSNGTFVNGYHLGEGSPATVQTGDRVDFGDVSCEVNDAENIYRVLRTLAL